MSSNKVPTNRVGLGALAAGLALLIVALCIGGALLFQSQLSGSRAPTPPAAPAIRSAATAVPSDTPTHTATPNPAPTDTPAAIPTVALGTSNVFIEYILDASGSMTETLRDGSVKIDVAKQVLTTTCAPSGPKPTSACAPMDTGCHTGNKPRAATISS